MRSEQNFFVFLRENIERDDHSKCNILQLKKESFAEYLEYKGLKRQQMDFRVAKRISLLLESNTETN